MEKIRKGDMVKVTSGKDRGKTGTVLQVLPRLGRLLVEGVNLRKRHERPQRQGQKGQIVQVSMPINRSNVLVVCPSCKVPQRTARLTSEGKTVRVCRKCKAQLP